MEDLRSRLQFFLQLDESTDVSSCAQLLVYARYISEDDIQEQNLVLEPFATTCKREDVLKIVKLCFEKHAFDWKRLVASVQMLLDL